MYGQNGINKHDAIMCKAVSVFLIIQQ